MFPQETLPAFNILLLYYIKSKKNHITEGVIQYYLEYTHQIRNTFFMGVFSVKTQNLRKCLAIIRAFSVKLAYSD